MTKVENFLEKRFTMVFLQLKKELNIDFDDYIVLENMVRRSNDNNLYMMEKSNLARFLKFSRGRLDGILNTLLLKEYISKSEDGRKLYHIKKDLKNKFSTAKENYRFYLKIFHEKRKLLDIEPSYFAMLYFVYVLSLKSEVGYATASVGYYCYHLDISKKNYELIINKLDEKKLLRNKSANKLTLDFAIYRWLEKSSKKGFGDYLFD